MTIFWKSDFTFYYVGLENQTQMSACDTCLYPILKLTDPCIQIWKYTGNPFDSFFSTVEGISTLVQPQSRSITEDHEADTSVIIIVVA